MTHRELIARSFADFVGHCLPGSPLYALLAAAVAEDTALLGLAERTRPGQPPPNMLFAAVHDLLLRGDRHPLAAFYPSLGGRAPAGPAAVAAFRDFCLGRAASIGELLATRLTQTNETARCAYLLPAFAMVQRLGGGRPLALIEVGASAGLNLNFDRYGYDYGDGREYGEPGAAVRLAAELRGDVRPPLPACTPEVAWRCVVDLSPVELGDPEAVRWLEALIWPEQEARLSRLRGAVAIALDHRPPVRRGDALALLPGLIAEAPAGAALCVFHTHVTYQFSAEMRARLEETFVAAGQARPVYRLSCEHSGAELPRLTLRTYGSGRVEERPLARTTGHANWIEWQAAA